ncbi:MAG: redoxin family protein [Planctomycetes bacterium]|nr:redoxin family protein [Planctomycetota bacterium]
MGGRVGAMGFGTLVPRAEFYDLHTLAREGALVVVLTSLRCPVARLYAPGIAEVAARHPQARFLVVGVAARDAPEDLRTAAERHGWSLVTHDPDGTSWARELQAQRTTECFVIDRKGVLRYRGAIDDQYGQGYRRAEPRRRYLEDALRAVLAGDQVAVPATTAPGCALVASPREAAR